MEHVEVSASSKTYSVVIGEGLRFRLGEQLEKYVHSSISSILIITDSTVAELYLEEVKSGLTNYSDVVDFIIPSGEASKSFQNYYDIMTYSLEKGLDRHSLVIALGGGVVGDLAGFVASTYMRGIPFVQVPTTLLAHDSSVGGKVAINHPLGKNMIGAFHQPEAVIYDIETLQSMPEHEWRSGFAEVLKHGFIWDKELYQWLQDNIENFSVIKGEKAEQLLKKSISVKAEVVAEDEKETGIRAYLNFGHTLAHAIETELGYGKITHGEAVAIGMIFALKLSERVFQTNLNIQEIEEWFKTYLFRVTIPEGLTAGQLLETMKKDKKVHNGVIRMVLLKQIGVVEIKAVSEEDLLALLKEEVGEVQ
ncbi:3-dehydroquinate synthase [Bacillus sp. FJAT-45350]|uniref:3-dehydroquinate synthase n=1 Tax=Bacillus sp. FJAT-45350 TaxID=2011014 RepID=UPI000BB8AADA|nr:3-dehydroquinate synthase [Bacillus sp. FJAT-45350]